MTPDIQDQILNMLDDVYELILPEYRRTLHSSAQGNKHYIIPLESMIKTLEMNASRTELSEGLLNIEEELGNINLTLKEIRDSLKEMTDD